MRTISIIFLFFINCTQAFSTAYQISKVDTIKNWLKSNVVSIENIDYKESSDDLHFLEELVGNKRIVFLGEQSHYDGSTNKAKLKLIKYLHDEMGFNVLIAELPLSRGYWINEASRNKADFIIGNTDGLPFNEDIYNLYSYIFDTKKTNSPIKYFGLDIDPLESRRYYERELLEIDKSLILTSEYQKYISMVELICNKRGAEVKIEELKNLVNFFVRKIEASDKLENSRKLFLLKIFSESYNFIYHLNSTPDLFFEKVFVGHYGENEAEKILEGLWSRDSLMANNFIWLYENIVPNEKIIVSASSYHISKNIDEIKTISPNLEKAIPMGQYISNKYPDELYSLAFIRHHGYNGVLEPYYTSPSPEYLITISGRVIPPGSIDSSMVFQLLPPPIGSIEELINSTGIKYGILDFSNQDKYSWLKGRNTMFPTFSFAYNVNWDKVYDGVFFIKEMEPIKYVSYKDLLPDQSKSEIMTHFGFVYRTAPTALSKKAKRRDRKLNKKLLKEWENEGFKMKKPTVH